eukprot:jgi/Phyca11/510145/fgenesh2_kg.PHYCAscaffold_54_\
MEPRYSKLLSHGVADAVLNHGNVADVLTQFRAYIGLTTNLCRPDPLVQWEPLDWGEELSITGHVTLRERSNTQAIPEPLIEFAFSRTDVPVIYFGVSACSLSAGVFDNLVKKIAFAAQQLRVRVIVQTREASLSRRSQYVYTVGLDVPYAQLFSRVSATIHWGDADILAEGLAAGKPVAVCGSHPSQLFAARVCQRAGVGIAPIDHTACTIESLVSSFQQLLQPATRLNTLDLARTFNPDRALDAAVNSFYSHLPLEAMVCDVDPTKLARVFDSHHMMKLSLEAYLAVQPVRDDSKGFVPYKPLLYDGFCPPVFSIRGNPGEIPSCVKPFRSFDAVGMAVEVLNKQDERRSNELYQHLSESSLDSIASRVVDSEVFWSSPLEEEVVRKATNAAYERLVKPERTRKRDKLAHMFGGKSKTVGAQPV